MPVRKGTHRWLVSALADQGYRQRDLAKAWGVNDAVVSRFVGKGEPALSLERADTLSRMLKISVDELLTRIGEKLPPTRKPAPRSEAMSPSGITARNPETVLAELREAVARARAALPSATIEVTIKLDEKL